MIPENISAQDYLKKLYVVIYGLTIKKLSEIVNAPCGYLKTLYDLNHKLIKLCGVDPLYPFDDKTILDIIQDITRIIPYICCGKDKLKLKDGDGLLEYQNDLPYLKKYYEKILLENYDFLNNIRKIRNKYAHKLHAVQLIGSLSSPGCIFSYTFKIEDENKNGITLVDGQFFKLIKALNNLFSKIVCDICTFAYGENKIKNSLYYIRITRFNFADFNKIYDDKLLKIIGQIMKDF